MPMWLGPAHKLHGGRAGGQGYRDTGGAALGEEEAQCTGLDVVLNKLLFSLELMCEILVDLVFFMYTLSFVKYFAKHNKKCSHYCLHNSVCFINKLYPIKINRT